YRRGLGTVVRSARGLRRYGSHTGTRPGSGRHLGRLDVGSGDDAAAAALPPRRRRHLGALLRQRAALLGRALRGPSAEVLLSRRDTSVRRAAPAAAGALRP